MSYLGLVSEYRYISYKTTRITISKIDFIDFVTPSKLLGSD